ncbi:MAG: chromate efflux transporter [Chitinophagales bacterium]|nr:chromate efflux transporter [Chitinophagales bacterium]
MRARDLIYLKDIFIVAVTSFGGPQGHLAVMHNILVKKRRYFTDDELLEVNALCQMLPGPASTQTIIVLSQKKGGFILALLSLLIWILPASAIMSFTVLIFSIFETRDLPTNFLIFIQPMAIGIIAYAGYSLGVQLIKNRTGIIIMSLAIIVALSITTPWTFPLVLIGAAIVTNITGKAQTVKETHSGVVNWKHVYFGLGLFICIFIIVGLLALVTKDLPFILFENFFRFGTITFGGGNVLVPMMFEQFVKHRHYMPPDEFVSGLAISQAIPGPSFAFAAFTGGMALKGMGAPFQLMGCIIGIVAIFLPGALMAFIIYPLWEYLKNYFFVRRSLEGINAASVGLIFSAAAILYTNVEFHIINIIVVIATFLLLNFTRIKVPVLVLFALIAGVIYAHL